MTIRQPHAPANAGARALPPNAEAGWTSTRRHASYAIAAITLGSLGLLVDLLLANHTRGGEIWGPVTSGLGAAVGLLSLAYLTLRSRSRAARGLLYALWLTVAFFGYGGFNDHRFPVTAQSTDQRQRPPLAPLTFTGLGIAGALVLRSGSKGN
jgi:hypothetical protein